MRQGDPLQTEYAQTHSGGPYECGAAVPLGGMPEAIQVGTELAAAHPTAAPWPSAAFYIPLRSVRPPGDATVVTREQTDFTYLTCEPTIYSLLSFARILEFELFHRFIEVPI